MPETLKLTIDDLAQRAGTATSTVRLYQSKGLLPPPVKEGRVGYYGDGHLARLRLIARLQEAGFSLAGIGQLLDASDQGRSLGEVLGLEDQVASTWAGEEPLLLAPEELAGHFPGGQLPAELAQRAFALGLIALDGAKVLVRSPRSLEIGTELSAMGIPLGELIDELELLQTETAVIAQRFTSLFERYLWAEFVARGLPAGEVRSLVGTLQRLSGLAEGVVEISLRDALKTAAAKFLAGQAPELRTAGVLEMLQPLAAAAGLELNHTAEAGGSATTPETSSEQGA